MQKAAGRYCNMLLRLLLLTVTAAAACTAVFAQQNPKDSVHTLADSSRPAANTGTYNEGSEVITTFKALNFPPEMLMHYGQISPDDIVTLIDEFQVTQKDEDGIAMLITVKLRFDSDQLIGYIREAPIDKSTDITMSDFIVKIPVEWLCTPETPDHPQHYVSSLEAIKMAETQYKCKGWHIKLPELDRPEQPNKKMKKQKKSKAKPAAKP